MRQRQSHQATVLRPGESEPENYVPDPANFPDDPDDLSYYLFIFHEGHEGSLLKI